MKNTSTLTRFWCHSCKEFTLHDISNLCTICNTENTSYDTNDIPQDKLEAQRKRYSKAKVDKILNLATSYLDPYTNVLQSMMFEDIEYTKNHFPDVIETDAGQIEIDKKNKKLRDEEFQKLKEERKARQLEYLQYKNLGRNDKCACGSDKKYKNCCLTRFQFI